MKLYNRLQDWLNQGFISQEQLTQIQEYEDKRARPWVSSAFMILGATVLGLGVISVIAANWDDISSPLKVIGDFIILIIAAAMIFDSWRKNTILKTDLWILFFLIFYSASLALITQIYNLSGPAYSLLLFWSLMTAALMIFAQHMFVSLLWITTFIYGLASFCYEAAIGQQIFDNQEVLIALTLSLLCSSGFFVSQYLSNESGITRSFRIITVVLWCVTLVVTEWAVPSHNMFHDKLAYPNIYTFIVAAASLIITIFACYKNVIYNVWQRNLIYTALLVLFAFTFLPYLNVSSHLIYAIGTMFILMLGAILFASLQKRGLFNFCVILLGLRFLVLYFQALGGLAATGVGLIFAGIMIIFMVKVWLKYQALLWDTISRWVYDHR